jgi:hypothetical protein
MVGGWSTPLPDRIATRVETGYSFYMRFVGLGVGVNGAEDLTHIGI